MFMYILRCLDEASEELAGFGLDKAMEWPKSVFGSHHSTEITAEVSEPVVVLGECEGAFPSHQLATHNKRWTI